jgi:hypothetical protein
MNSEERDIILEQSVASEDNLRVALLIGTYFPDLRCRIISSFAEYVSSRLRDRFASALWRVTNEMGIDG